MSQRFLRFICAPRPVYRFVRFLMLLAVVVVGLPAQSGAQPTCLPDGDVDQNGSVTAADALLAFQQALGLTQLSACQQTIADVFPQPANPDGNITASDALCIFQKALSLPSCLDTLPPSNQPPVVDAGPDQSIAAGTMVMLSGTASDPDGTIVAYAWTQTGGTMIPLPGAASAMAAFTAPDVTAAETLTFRLTVLDDEGAQASDEVRVTVRPVEQDSLEVSVLGEGAIRVVGAGDPLDCGAVTVCQGQFDAGSEVVLEAVAASGWRHEGWSGCDETGSGRCTVFMDDDRSVSVTFVSAEPQVAGEVFRQHISGQIVQTKCVTCHVQDGASGNTRLVFVRSADTPDHEALNLQTFQDFLAAVTDEGGGSYVLNKIQGVGHGGGVQVSPGSPEFANMQQFLGLLGEEVEPAPLTPETLFDTVVMALPRKTLRRAALIFAGRIPTEEEYAAVEGGDESVLRATIRGLMEGPQFHEFLIRASNDRLLTDRRSGPLLNHGGYFVDFVNELYRRRKIAHTIDTPRAWEDYYRWGNSVDHGVIRAPLELIAYVAEHDLPYTEILTADYIMANPMAAAAYGDSTQFDDPTDPYEFKPSRIVSYYREGEGYVDEYDFVVGARRVINPGLITDYPHAGILNTTVFLQRYPTTATNRNRARARWTYYHFLGLDVEKSASRTTDPLALADTNNPTMHNPACTVCHSVLDPVAGAFQNYGDVGYYKDQWGGYDSLDPFYKDSNGPELSVLSDTWEDRETLSWTVTLAAGIGTLRVVFTGHDTDESWRVHLDRLDVRDADGQVVVSKEFEDLAPPVAHWGDCGEAQYNPATGRHDHFFLWGGYFECAFLIDVEVPGDGVYHVEIVAWSNRLYEQSVEDGLAKLSVTVNPYQDGDTWYNDMRTPGFAGAQTPHPDSLQWLAGQIVAEERFAEAAIKFWWPAVMGREVAEAPEDAADADFEERLLAFNAQDAEIERLASGFRDGFLGSPYTHNLKDLLVEIVLSEWFRADAVTDADPVRHLALRDAGARRLLTPEELARKTAAITGVQWGRYIPFGCCNQWNSSRLTDDYRLFYGGIDSDGVTERARAITAVMAGVAKRHAVQVSCPVVGRELFLLPDQERRLFAGIDPRLSPISELGAVFEIQADTWDERETLSLSGRLTAEPKTVTFTYRNPQAGRVIRLDRLDVRNAAGQVVASHEIEDAEWSGGGCDGPGNDHFYLGCSSSIDVPLDGLVAGNYAIEIVAWADHAGDELPKLSVVVESNAEGSTGAASIRNKLVELHDKLLGVQVAPDSPDVEAAYRLFVEVWERGRATGYDGFNIWSCQFWHDRFFFEGILDDIIVEMVNEHGHRWYGLDQERYNNFLGGIDFSDSHPTAQAWVVVLTAMMMDYRYLYLN